MEVGINLIILVSDHQLDAQDLCLKGGQVLDEVRNRMNKTKIYASERKFTYKRQEQTVNQMPKGPFY